MHNSPPRVQHANIHISPDIFDETWAGVRLNRLVAWALSPCEDEVLQMMFDKGRCDAAAWAQLTGVLDAAAPDPDDWYRYQQMQVRARACVVTALVCARDASSSLGARTRHSADVVCRS